MNNTNLLRELRALTSAGMKDCRDALKEAGNDLQKAVDLIKVKGLAISDGRSGAIASEGRVVIMSAGIKELAVMMEINAQTDFTSNSDEFVEFSEWVTSTFLEMLIQGQTFQPSDVEDARQGLSALTKENIVVRRWWAEEAQQTNVRVFSYLHSNNKIGVLLTMAAPNEQAAYSSEFQILGEDLTMQIAAMCPLAISPERLSPEDIERQKAIFETQLREEKKPEKMWGKIMEGKMSKYHKEVCLLEQESVIKPKTSVKQVINDVESVLDGSISVINFVRCMAGEGIEKKTDNFADEVAKMTQGE